MLPAHLTTTLVILLICFPAFSSAEPGTNAPKAVEDGYTMVVLPDTQLYAWKHQKTFLEQPGWIAENAKHYNIKCVLHVGDIVQNNNDQEWKTYYDDVNGGILPTELVEQARKLEMEWIDREEIYVQRKEKFLNIGKQKTFTVFSKEAAWISKSNFFEFVKKILFKFKKELIIASLIFAAVLFLI